MHDVPLLRSRKKIYVCIVEIEALEDLIIVIAIDAQRPLRLQQLMQNKVKSVVRCLVESFEIDFA